MAWSKEFIFKFSLQRSWFLLLDHLQSYCLYNCMGKYCKHCIHNLNKINSLRVTWSFNTALDKEPEAIWLFFLTQSLTWMLPWNTGVLELISRALNLEPSYFGSCWVIGRWYQFLYVRLGQCPVTGICWVCWYVCVPSRFITRAWAGDYPALG